VSCRHREAQEISGARSETTRSARGETQVGSRRRLRRLNATETHQNRASSASIRSRSGCGRPRSTARTRPRRLTMTVSGTSSTPAAASASASCSQLRSSYPTAPRTRSATDLASAHVAHDDEVNITTPRPISRDETSTECSGRLRWPRRALKIMMTTTLAVAVTTRTRTARSLTDPHRFADRDRPAARRAVCDRDRRGGVDEHRSRLCLSGRHRED